MYIQYENILIMALDQMCNVCNCLTTVVHNPFKKYVGCRPARISELVMRVTNYELKLGSKVCEKCVNRLSEYHEALQLVQLIEKEFMNLLNKKVDIVNTKIKQLEEVSTDFIAGEFVSEEKDVIDAFEHKSQQCELKRIKEEEKEIDSRESIEFLSINGNPDEFVIDDDMKIIEKKSSPKQISSDSSDVESIKLKRASKNDKKQGLSCNQCGQSFSTKRKCKEHINSEHSVGFICEHCGKSIKKQSGLLAHLQCHDTNKNFICIDCGQRFKTNYLLRLHMAWHTGERPFECDVCQKRFVHKLALYRHKHIHDEEGRRKQCNVCGFKFRTSSHLSRHMLTHTGAKPHSCPICGKCFAQRYNMRSHLREHENPGSTRQRRFRCKKCTRTFVNKEHYEEHCQLNDCKLMIE